MPWVTIKNLGDSIVLRKEGPTWDLDTEAQEFIKRAQVGDRVRWKQPTYRCLDCGAKPVDAGHSCTCADGFPSTDLGLEPLQPEEE